MLFNSNFSNSHERGPVFTPVNIVYGFIEECGAITSPATWVAFKGLKIMHCAWWMKRKVVLYKDPDNWLFIAAGWGINHFVGNGKLKRYLQIYSLTIRIGRVIDEVNLLKSDLTQWKMTFISSRIGAKPVGENARCVSIRIIFSGNSFHQIVLVTTIIVKRVGLISMKCMDAYAVFYIDMNNDEIVFEGLEGIGRLAEQKEFIIESLRQRRDAMDQVITRLSLPMTANQVIDSVSTGLKYASAINMVGKSVSQYGGKVTVDAAKGLGEFVRALSW